MRTLQKNSRWLNRNGKSIFWSFACLLFVFSSLYAYFVNTAALNAVRLGKAAAEQSGMRARISELEYGYLSRKQNVTLSLAYRTGFEDARAIRFLGRKSIGVLSRNNDL